jgi:hypothetical protein
MSVQIALTLQGLGTQLLCADATRGTATTPLETRMPIATTRAILSVRVT